MIREVKLSIKLVKMMNWGDTIAFFILQHRYLIRSMTLGVTWVLGAFWYNLTVFAFCRPKEKRKLEKAHVVR